MASGEGLADLLRRIGELLSERRTEDADAELSRVLSETAGPPAAALAQRAGILAQRAGEPRLAIRWYRRAGELSPSDPEPRHDRGIAHLEAGEVGLAAQAQAEALSLDPDHPGARAQRAAALEALGDDAGAAEELAELLARIGPRPALAVRLDALRAAATRAAHRRLLGAPPSALASSPLIGAVFARSPSRGGLSFRSPFGELTAQVRSGPVVSLSIVFADMDASLARSDLSYGATTEDEHGRRVPLDEFTAAATVFLSQACGVETLRARRLLAFLLAPEAGLGPHAYAGLRVSWVIDGEGEGRRYGLAVALPATALN